MSVALFLAHSLKEVKLSSKLRALRGFVDYVGLMGAQVRRWRVSNSSMGQVGCVGLKLGVGWCGSRIWHVLAWIQNFTRFSVGLKFGAYSKFGVGQKFYMDQNEYV